MDRLQALYLAMFGMASMADFNSFLHVLLSIGGLYSLYLDHKRKRKKLQNYEKDQDQFRAN